MNYPDGFNADAFNSIFGTRMTAQDEALEGHKAAILLAIKNAFEQYPLDTKNHALRRWVEIRKNGLDKAYETFDFLIGFSKADETLLFSELNYGRDANNDHDIEAVIQAAESYMFIIERAVSKASN